MKNKNGFTMIELLAVLGILALLTIVIVPNVSSLRQKTLQQTYDNKVNQVKIAAKEWGSDNLISVPSSVSKEYTDHLGRLLNPELNNIQTADFHRK